MVERLAGAEWALKDQSDKRDKRDQRAGRVAEGRGGWGGVISKFACITHAKLESAGAAVELVVVDGDAIIQAQGANGEVEAQTEAPVVIQIVQVEVVRPYRHVANIIEQRETQALDNGNAVLRRTKP